MKISKLILYIIPVIQLGILFFIKYFNVNSSLSEFKLTYIGNSIEVALTISLLIGTFVFTTRKDLVKKYLKYLLAVSIIYLGTLLAALFFVIAKISISEVYLFGYPFMKVFVAALLASYKLIYFYLIYFVWFTIFSKKINVIFYSTVFTAVTIIALILFSYIYNLSYVPKKTNELKKGNNLAVVLGAAVWSKNVPSPLFRGRILKAAELYDKGIVKKIQVTGGNAPGEISEAKAAYNLLVSQFKINPKDILIEENTSTTSEQIQFIKKILNYRSDKSKVLIISDLFHLRRVLEMCDFLNVDAIGISSEYKLNWEKLFFYRLRDSIGLLLFWFFAI